MRRERIAGTRVRDQRQPDERGGVQIGLSPNAVERVAIGPEGDVADDDSPSARAPATTRARQRRSRQRRGSQARASGARQSAPASLSSAARVARAGPGVGAANRQRQQSKEETGQQQDVVVAVPGDLVEEERIPAVEERGDARPRDAAGGGEARDRGRCSAGAGEEENLEEEERDQQPLAGRRGDEPGNPCQAGP